jgi:hypothetical protein
MEGEVTMVGIYCVKEESIFKNKSISEDASVPLGREKKAPSRDGGTWKGKGMGLGKEGNRIGYWVGEKD